MITQIEVMGMSELAEIQCREDGEPFCLDVGHRRHYQKTGEKCSCIKFVDYKSYEQLQSANQQLLMALKLNDDMLTKGIFNCTREEMQVAANARKEAITNAKQSGND